MSLPLDPPNKGQALIDELFPESERAPNIRSGEREPISQVVRRLVYRRDNWMCQNCGASPFGQVKARESGALHLDHIVPWSAGGSDRSDNLRTLCGPCNMDRSNFVTGQEKPVLPIVRICTPCLTMPERMPPTTFPVYCACRHHTSWAIPGWHIMQLELDGRSVVVTREPVVGPGLSTPIDPAVDGRSGRSGSEHGPTINDWMEFARRIWDETRRPLLADLAEARAGLSFWSRRYGETERQARVDVAAKDRYKAGYAALKAAVEGVRAHHSMIEPPELNAGFCQGCEFTWPCPTFEMVSEEAIHDAALAAAVPTPTKEAARCDCPKCLHEATTPEPEGNQP